MFPGPHAEVFYNEAGEPLGWDNHYYDEPDYDPYEEDREADAEAAAAEDAYFYALDDQDASQGKADAFSVFRVRHCKGLSLQDAWRKFTEKRP